MIARASRSLIRSQLRSGLATAIALLGLSLTPDAAQAARSVPPPPAYYVLDEPNALSAPAKQALQSLLVEHDHLRGEQILIAIYQSAGKEDPSEVSRDTFQKWGVGLRNGNKGVLISVFWEERKARMEVGFGLEPLLPEFRTQQLLEDFLLPELRNDKMADRALSLTAFQLLSTLESPLIPNGKADETLRAGGFRGSLHASSTFRTPTVVWSLVFLAGLGIFLAVLGFVTAAEAHYTSEGRCRPRPWNRLLFLIRRARSARQKSAAFTASGAAGEW